MKLRLIACALAGAGFAAAAGAKTPVNADLLQVKSEAKASRAELLAAVTTTGDEDSFGRNVKYLGLLTTGSNQLATDCTPDPDFPPGPDDHCIVVNPAPATTTFTINDAARMIIPGKSSESLYCQWQTPVVVWTFRNPTAVQANARLLVTPQYKIENEVLNDPALIDPNTGLPFGGSITIALPGIRRSRTLGPGEVQTERENGTRTCIGGLVSQRSLVESYGLTPALAKKFFRKDSIVTMNLTGSAALVDFASLIYGTRFVGD